LRGSDLSGEDLKAIPAEVLITRDFDTKTTFGAQAELPPGLIRRKSSRKQKIPVLGDQRAAPRRIDGRGIRWP